MTTITASYLGIFIGFMAIGLLTFWYVKPFVNRQPLSLALTVLIIPHVFRYIALQLFSAQAQGLVISDGGRGFYRLWRCDLSHFGACSPLGHTS